MLRSLWGQVCSPCFVLGAGFCLVGRLPGLCPLGPNSRHPLSRPPATTPDLADATLVESRWTHLRAMGPPASHSGCLAPRSARAQSRGVSACCWGELGEGRAGWRSLRSPSEMPGVLPFPCLLQAGRERGSRKPEPSAAWTLSSVMGDAPRLILRSAWVSPGADGVPSWDGNVAAADCPA